MPKMESTAEKLIRVVEEERSKRQLDQGEFSKLLGISASYYSMVLNGRRKPNLFVLGLFKQKLPDLKTHIDSYISYITEGNDHNIQKG